MQIDQKLKCKVIKNKFKNFYLKFNFKNLDLIFKV